MCRHCRVTDALLLCGTLLTKCTVRLIAINQRCGTKYALTKHYFIKLRLLMALLCLWILIIVCTSFHVIIKESSYKVTCLTSNHCSRIENLTVNFSITMLTFLTAVFYYKYCAQSSKRVAIVFEVPEILRHPL